MEKSYIEYAMSVIVGRALPDVRDGLKPVHRRILYAMYEDGLTVGQALQEVRHLRGRRAGPVPPPRRRLACTTPWSAWPRTSPCAIPLVDGHGNFGSVDGDPPAAYRYTEARMSKHLRRDAAGHRKGHRGLGPQL